MAAVKGPAAGIVLILVLSFASSAMAQRIPGQTARPAAIQGRIVDGNGDDLVFAEEANTGCR